MALGRFGHIKKFRAVLVLVVFGIDPRGLQGGAQNCETYILCFT